MIHKARSTLQKNRTLRRKLRRSEWFRIDKSLHHGQETLRVHLRALAQRLSGLHNTPVDVETPARGEAGPAMSSSSERCSCVELQKTLRETRAELARTRDRLLEARQQIRELEHDRTSLEQALTRVLELDRVLQSGHTPFRAFREWETPNEDRLFSRAGGMNTPWLERSAVWFSPREHGSARRALIIQEALEKRFLEDKTPGDEWGCSPVLQTSDLTFDQVSLPANNASTATDQEAEESTSRCTAGEPVSIKSGRE
ncbi:hypothetical protein F1559_000212 [Cyanidiococcus yangmingshanensis]|uniref:Uncharacterized protein n=1 Tax=Cyanidiococcus yangmingshanensis TaxID=2690220 RepID=A0A7J7IPN8_9RHOD|nr:hypothetical protein F1559_000212 [Cyanidiococcus yangmingshanensis]